MKAVVGAVCLHQPHTTGKAIGFDFSALEHREATHFVADEKAKGLTTEQVLVQAGASMIQALKGNDPRSGGLARFFAAALVIAAREMEGRDAKWNCLTADEDESGRVIAGFALLPYDNVYDFMRTDIQVFEGAQPPAA